MPDALALTVSPLQVTVKGPAGMLCPAVLNVSLRTLLNDLSNVVAIDDGTVTPQPPVDPLVMRLAVFGKVRRMKSDVALIAVAVVKEMVAAPPFVMGLVGNADSVGATSAAVV